jgi:hypothetical protein
MAVSLAEVLRELSLEDRDEVERGARRLLIESRTLRTICQEFSGNHPCAWCGERLQAPTVFRIVLKADVPGLRRAVSMTVRIAASPSAAPMAR